MSMNPTTSSVPFTKFISAESNCAANYHGILPFLKSSEHRDSILRLIQYSIRFVIFLKKQRKYKLTPTLVTTLSIISTLSALRRILNLFDIISTVIQLGDRLNPIRYYYSPSYKVNDKKGKGKALSTSVTSNSELIVSPSIVKLLRETLDLTSTISDNIYLFSILSILPLSKKKTKLVDQLSDLTSLTCSLLGLYQLSKTNSSIYKNGRALNTNLIELEERYQRREFWEEGSSRSGEDEVSERRKLKGVIKNERRRLKSLRDDANTIWWDRIRLICEAVFSAYDLSEIEIGKESVKATAGITSASILFVQAWLAYLKNG